MILEEKQKLCLKAIHKVTSCRSIGSVDKVTLIALINICLEEGKIDYNKAVCQFTGNILYQYSGIKSHRDLQKLVNNEDIKLTLFNLVFYKIAVLNHIFGMEDKYRDNMKLETVRDDHIPKRT